MPGAETKCHLLRQKFSFTLGIEVPAATADKPSLEVASEKVRVTCKGALHGVNQGHGHD